MFRFLIEKLKQAPGPLKQPRLILGDLAEELLDLTEHYLNRLRGRAPESTPHAPPAPVEVRSQPPRSASSAPKEEPEPKATSKPAKKKAKKSSSKKVAARSVKAPPVKRTLEVDERLSKTLDHPSNQKKQDFKVLAILWDAKQRDLGFMSAKEISKHGEKLGLVIRHENVRKVIRMRLEDSIEIHTEQGGNGSVYRYRLASGGSSYFEETYFGK